jgi:hypothetical protein
MEPQITQSTQMEAVPYRAVREEAELHFACFASFAVPFLLAIGQTALCDPSQLLSDARAGDLAVHSAGATVPAEGVPIRYHGHREGGDPAVLGCGGRSGWVGVWAAPLVLQFTTSGDLCTRIAFT